MSARLVAPAFALVATLVLAASGALGRLDLTWHDWLQRTLAPSGLADADTALVLIDEQSLQAMGSERYGMRWPWPRHAFAALFAGLHQAGAKAIVADFLFVENSDDGLQDAILGSVAAALPEVTLGARIDLETGAVQRPVFWTEDFRQAWPALFEPRARWGYVNSDPDDDGVLRRYLFAGSLVDAASGGTENEEALQPLRVRWRGTLDDVRARDVPVVPAASFVAAGLDLLNAALEQAPDLEPLPIAQALAEQPPPTGEIFELVRGRTVFVGANAAGAFDYIATPAGSPEPGVLLHWNAWQNLAGDEFLREPGVAMPALAVVLAVAAVAFVGRRGTGLRRPLVAAAGVAVVALAGSAGVFSVGVWFPPASPVVAAAVTFTAVAVDSFRRERARKREIQGWFGAYVSPAVVQRLVDNPDALKLGGERREVSVFFSDLVGFTTMSEKLPAEGLVTVTNLCLEELSEPVFEHGGYLDKYIGDSVMSVFGSPEPLANDALSATRAALACQRRVLALNERLQREHGVTVGVRFGINSGEAVVGNVGSTRKKNYTVLGDTVNLASRLEGANKEFHTEILLGPSTAARVAGEILTRPVARLRVKGKTRAVDVHEPLGEVATADPETRRFAAACKEGFDAYTEQRFAQAERAFGEALALRPDDFLTSRYLAEVRRLIAMPPSSEWEPILNLESK